MIAGKAGIFIPDEDAANYIGSLWSLGNNQDCRSCLVLLQRREGRRERASRSFDPCSVRTEGHPDLSLADFDLCAPHLTAKQRHSHGKVMRQVVL